MQVANFMNDQTQSILKLVRTNSLILGVLVSLRQIVK